MSTLNFQSTKITVIGMGYVGLPLAIEFGKKWQTVGFDIDETRIKELNDRNDITGEVTAKDFAEAKHIQYTFNADEIIDSSIYIVTVPTPITPNNLPDLNAIKSATKLISSVISDGDTVIYESTVYPGLTEEICIPILENDNFIAFEDINPQAKIHTLIIPKVHIQSFNEMTPNVMAEMTTFIQEVALTLGVKSDGYRLITNIGQNGNQEVKHIHFHLLAGEQLGKLV